MAEQLRRRVSAGELRVGQALPSERQLATEFGVARDTARAAIKSLELDGVIVRNGQRRRIERVPARHRGLLATTIGILTIHRDREVFRRCPGWESVVDLGAMEEIRTRKHNPLILQIEALTAPEAWTELLDRPPRGVVVCSAVHRNVAASEALRRLQQAGVPVVVEGDPAGAEVYDRVVSDHARGAELMTAWLIAQGRHRVVTMLPSQPYNQYWAQRRLEGYRRAMRAAGLEPLAPIYQAFHGEAGLSERDRFNSGLMNTLGCLYDFKHTSGGFDAVMAASDAQVPMVIAACRKLGMTPGRDVLVGGYDNFWNEWTDRPFEAEPPAATVDKDNALIGREMVRLLLSERIPGQGSRIVAVPPRLIHPVSGESTSH